MRSAGVLAVVLCVPLLWLGAVTDAGLLAAALAASAWAFVVAWNRPRMPEGWPVRLASGALGGAVAWSALQLVPLPPGLLRVLSPHAAAIWARADALLGRAPQAHSISIDPPATSFALVGALAAFLVYRATVRYAGDKDARVRVLWAVVAAVLVLDVVAMGHMLAGLDKVYGVYAPRHIGARILLSPVMNSNHAAAVACVAPPLLFGLALDAPVPKKVLAGVAAVFSGAVAITALSRGGMLVLGLELALMSVYAVSRRRGVGGLLPRALTGVVVIGATVAAALLVAREPIAREASDHDFRKLQIPLHALRLVRDFPRAGVGRGAFGAIFESYQADFVTGARHTHVESWPVQLVADHGVVAAGAFVIALAAAAWAARARLFARPEYAGAAVALLGLVVHDLFDFAMEFAGAAMLATALLAVVTTAGVRRERTPPARERWYLPAGAAVSAAAAVALLVASWGRRGDDEAARFTERTKTEHPSTLRADFDAAVSRHPADPHFFGLAGLARIRTPDAGPFLVRAIELGPNRGLSHLLLGRWFATFGRKAQGFAEYREAVRVDPSMRGRIAEEMVRFDADRFELVALASSEAIVDVAVPLLERKGRHDDAQALDDHAVATFPPAVTARVRTIERARAAKDLDRARRLARELMAAAPGAPKAYAITASLEPDEAIAEEILALGLQKTGDLALREELVRRRGKRLGLEAITADLAALQEAYEQSGAPPWKTSVLKAEIERARGRASAAIHHYLAAAASAPEDVRFLEAAAGLASQSGQTALAMSLWGRLAALRPDVPKYREMQQKAKGSAPAGIAPAALAPPGAPLAP